MANVIPRTPMRFRPASGVTYMPNYHPADELPWPVARYTPRKPKRLPRLPAEIVNTILIDHLLSDSLSLIARTAKWQQGHARNDFKETALRVAGTSTTYARSVVYFVNQQIDEFELKIKKASQNLQAAQYGIGGWSNPHRRAHFAYEAGMYDERELAGSLSSFLEGVVEEIKKVLVENETRTLRKELRMVRGENEKLQGELKMAKLDAENAKLRLQLSRCSVTW